MREMCKITWCKICGQVIGECETPDNFRWGICEVCEEIYYPSTKIKTWNDYFEEDLRKAQQLLA